MTNGETNGEEFDSSLHERARYRDLTEIGTGDLYEALMSLASFAENPYLPMYELLRTWRQRCEEVIKLAENAGLDMRLVT